MRRKFPSVAPSVLRPPKGPVWTWTYTKRGHDIPPPGDPDKGRRATQEHSLEQLLQRLEDTWTGMELAVLRWMHKAFANGKEAGEAHKTIAAVEALRPDVDEAPPQPPWVNVVCHARESCTKLGLVLGSGSLEEKVYKVAFVFQRPLFICFVPLRRRRFCAASVGEVDLAGDAAGAIQWRHTFDVEFGEYVFSSELATVRSAECLPTRRSTARCSAATSRWPGPS